MEFTTPEKTSFQRVNRLLYPTSSPSGVATENRLSIALLCQHQRTKQPLGQLQNFGLKQLKLSFEHRRRTCVSNDHQPNFKLRNVILTASFFWR
ncbi:hypothetical protein ACJ7R3_004699, partial [Vibrio parahaemolyticus]